VQVALRPGREYAVWALWFEYASLLSSLILTSATPVLVRFSRLDHEKKSDTRRQESQLFRFMQHLLSLAEDKRGDGFMAVIGFGERVRCAPGNRVCVSDLVAAVALPGGLSAIVPRGGHVLVCAVLRARPLPLRTRCYGNGHARGASNDGAGAVR
jgi:hypothetical protein